MDEILKLLKMMSYSNEEIEKWFNTPLKTLGNSTPLQLCVKGESDYVLARLKVICGI